MRHGNVAVPEPRRDLGQHVCKHVAIPCLPVSGPPPIPVHQLSEGAPSNSAIEGERGVADHHAFGSDSLLNCSPPRFACVQDASAYNGMEAQQASIMAGLTRRIQLLLSLVAGWARDNLFSVMVVVFLPSPLIGLLVS